MTGTRIVRATGAMTRKVTLNTRQVRYMTAPPLHKVKIHDAARGVDIPTPIYPMVEVLNSSPMLKTGVIALAGLVGLIAILPNFDKNWRGAYGERKE